MSTSCGQCHGQDWYPDAGRTHGRTARLHQVLLQQQQQQQQAMARRLTFEDEQARPSLALDGLSKAIPCIGRTSPRAHTHTPHQHRACVVVLRRSRFVVVRGLVAPLSPSSELLHGELSIGELNLRLLTVGVRSLSEQVHGTDIQHFMDVETRELRYPPLQLPSLQQLPVYQQRSAESVRRCLSTLPSI